MYADAFDDNRSCTLGSEEYGHGSEVCESEGMHCKVCINGRWADKLRSERETASS